MTHMMHLPEMNKKVLASRYLSFARMTNKYGTMTGSGSKSNLMVVPSAPSKVTNTPSLSVVWTVFETPAEMDLTSR